ncbi:MAG TPA: Asp-tRNA(Asn)/Glu-tRNA(Gln) amidotransferase subunit GatC, partial [Gemmatimonadales bacterium]|nr:Asp-tRNA(Asn)/Glu-tRNA(Gln) amidotransferase subunit GatC [Gemmatimonadales bacterium]
MSIGRDQVLHVAKLAELAVEPEELERLVGQMNRIVDYVAQLDQVAAEPSAEAFLPGPASVNLREDVEGAMPLARSPGDLAPEFTDGFFLVPR